MVVSVGSQINGYTVIETLYNRDHLDIYQVTDAKQESHVLKMYKTGISLSDDKIEEFSIKCFVWNGIKCVIHDDQCLKKKDYFNLKDSNESGRAGPTGRQSGGIVRTPMPCGPSSDEEEEEEDDDDEDDDEDDEDDDEDDEDDDEDDEDDDEDDEDDEGEDELESDESGDEESYSPVVHLETPPDADKPRPILLRDTNSSQRGLSRVNIQSPVQKAFHLSHRNLPRTPMPEAVRTEESDESRRCMDQEKCRFQLKMISSSMLKRRSARSLAM